MSNYSNYDEFNEGLYWFYTNDTLKILPVYKPKFSELDAHHTNLWREIRIIRIVRRTPKQVVIDYHGCQVRTKLYDVDIEYCPTYFLLGYYGCIHWSKLHPIKIPEYYNPTEKSEIMETICKDFMNYPRYLPCPNLPDNMKYFQVEKQLKRYFKAMIIRNRGISLSVRMEHNRQSEDLLKSIFSKEVMETYCPYSESKTVSLLKLMKQFKIDYERGDPDIINYDYLLTPN